MKRTKLDDRVLPEYTRGEEIFNMVTHIVGGVFGIAVLVLCIVFGVLRHNNYGIASGIIYGISKYSLQGTTQGNGLTGGLPPVRFSM